LSDLIGPKTDQVIEAKKCSNKVCVLKVVAELGQHLEQPPYYCIASDAQGTLCAVSVFNAAMDFHLQRGDSIAVAQPQLTKHIFQFTSLSEQKMKSDRVFDVSFPLLRVNTPLDLVVNGRKGNKGMQAMVSVGVEAKAS